MVFHIGLHKTGTTFLQQEVFPVIDDFYLIRKSFYDLITNPSEKTPLVSYELLSGHPWKGEWMSEYRENVKQISKYWPRSKCIIGFRRHDRLIASLYKQYLHQGGVKSIQFLFSPDGSGRIGPSDLSFRRRVEIAEACFSKVFVYTQEELKNRFESFIKKLQLFLDTDDIRREQINRSQKNVGVKTKLQVILLRRLNKIDKSLRKLPTPTLNNYLFRKFNLTPRSLCQYRLQQVGQNPWTLPSEIENYLQSKFSDDWEYVNEVSGQVGA